MVAGKVITADALHTQRAISASIVERGGDYIWPVKTNQPRLYEDIERLFAPDNPKPGFGKISTDFQQQQRSIMDMEGWKNAPSKPVPCSMTTLIGLAWGKSIV